MTSRANSIAMGLLLILAFAAGWAVNGWRADAELANREKAWADAIAWSSQQALERYQIMEKTKDDAIKAAEQRAASNRADADRAAATVDSMRKQLAGVPARIATATRAAVDEYAATASELLTDCTAQYQRVAEQADGHASDAALIRDAWPAVK